MYKQLLEKICEYDRITVFRHQRPDGDCMFSSLALCCFLKDNFKEKRIMIAGNDVYDLFPYNENIADDFIRSSLGIVIDTSTLARIDDDRVQLCDYIIKIDHHPVVENYGDLNYVNDIAGAAAEILTEILFSEDFESYIKSSEVCKYLYCAILADTINFRTSSTTADTLKAGALLAEKGDLSISELSDFILNVSSDTFRKITDIRKHLNVSGNFGYIVLNHDDLEAINITALEAKNHITEIGNITDLNVWAFTVESEGRFDCSIRSKKNYQVNDIAMKYGGGGHFNASGVRGLSLEQLTEMYAELSERSK
ncbi:MAG: bifunctional oligoribonuclease/PAP phosphatase NrnA [Erysipelotrichaceae bacterium]|nr:bifunctional oligoribonuclease/PAP phosphatase NrnA [Erysipelotrichaceae bacterium]